DAVRQGGGPRFLHARTYRLLGHTGVDPAQYRPAAEVEAKRREDPILRAAELLLAAGVPAAALEADGADAAREMAAAFDDASAAPFPDSAAAFADVQDLGAPMESAA